MRTVDYVYLVWMLLVTVWLAVCTAMLYRSRP